MSETSKIHDLKKMKIQDALQLLEESAQEASGDFKSILNERYKTVESAVESLFGSTPKEIFAESKDKFKSAAKQAQNVARDTANNLDSAVHENPWAFIGGGVALGAIIGFMLGRKG